MVLIHNIVALIDVLHIINSILSAVQIHLCIDASNATLTISHLNPCYRCQVDVHMVVVKTDSDTKSVCAGVCVEELIAHLLRYDRMEGVNISVINGVGGSTLTVNGTALSYTVVPDGDETVSACDSCRPVSVPCEDVLTTVKQYVKESDYRYDFMSAFTTSLPETTSLVFRSHISCTSRTPFTDYATWSFIADAGILRTSLTISQEIAGTSTSETMPESAEVMPISA